MITKKVPLSSPTKIFHLFFKKNLCNFIINTFPLEINQFKNILRKNENLLYCKVKNHSTYNNIISFSKYYYSSTHHEKQSNNIKQKQSSNTKFIYCGIFASCLIGYGLYGYFKKSENDIFFPFKKIISIGRSIYNFLTLPYNSYVLLDKLIPTTKGVEKTLVLNLNKTLVSYKYSLFDGFEILKRPGLQKFIEELSKVYEIVIFSNEDIGMIEEISLALDPSQKYINSKLGKESIRIYKGRSIKDLNYLNRNLSNVVVLDFDLDNVQLHPNNTIVVPEFSGDGKDRELLYLLVFLKEMGRSDIKDIRNELKKWGNYKPYIKYYESNPKFKKLLPNHGNSSSINDDPDLNEIRKEKNRKYYLF